MIGFKALGEDGRGTPVSGSIVDSRGKRVAGFITLHAGMGVFELTPLAGEDYTAKVESTEGELKNYPLPKVESRGIVLHISNPEKSAEMEISLTGLESIPSDSFYLIGSARGRLCYAQKVTDDQPTLSVPKNLFPTGVARFTLFNGIKPLNERIVFIDHQNRLQIEVTPHKPNYGERDSVSLAIEVKDKDGFPVQGSFSLSVTDDSQVKADSLGDKDIAATLLINASLRGNNRVDLNGYYGIISSYTYLKAFKDIDLKSSIESPGYYVNRYDPKVWQALDNLMLTQGWTDYKWETVFSPDKPIYFNAQNSFDITGKVLNILNGPVAGAQVLVSSQKSPFIGAALTDKNGTFVFENLLKLDSGSFFFQANTRNGKRRNFGTIKIDRPFNPYGFHPALEYPAPPWYVNSDTTEINLIKRRAEQLNEANMKLPGILLKEVNIRGKKIIRGSRNPYGPGNADYIFGENDIKTSGLTNLYDFLTQKIPGLRSAGYSRVGEGDTFASLSFNHRHVDIKIDGNPLQIDDINSFIEGIEELSKYQLTNIRGIELIHSKKYTRGLDAFPKLVITSYDGKEWMRHFKAGAIQYRPLPISPPKVFYQPKYTSDLDTSLPDYRPTIYWNPNITTDQDGRATVTFYTSDSAGGLTLNLQGMGVDGSLGSLFYRLKP